MTDSAAMSERENEQREAIRKKLSNRWWRLNNLYYITDEKAQHIKFVPNKSQAIFYWAMWWLNVILKARQLGFSTFIQIFLLDACLFNDNVRAGVIAHTLDDAEVLFRDKIKYAYDNLPSWLKAERPAVNDKVGEMKFANGSSVRVGTSMRSGTLQYLHVSELGKIANKHPEKAEEIRSGALNTVHEGGFIFFESTAEGRNGLFFETVEDAQKIQQMGREPNVMEFKLHFFPWWEDDRYRMDPKMVTLTAKEIKYFHTLETTEGIKVDEEQRAWYALKARQQKDKMLREFPSTIKEAFEAKIKGAIYAEEIAKTRLEGRITTVPYEPSLPVNTFWDLGRNDMNCIWFHQRFGLQNRFIDYYENRGESLAHYAKIIKERGYVYGEHYLPHDVVVTDLSREDNKSRAEVLEDLNVKPLIAVPRIQDLGEGIEMTRQAFNSCWFDESKCDQGLKGLEAYQRQYDDKLQTYKERPLHNWASNPSDAFRQFAQGYSAPKSTTKRKRRTNWKTA